MGRQDTMLRWRLIRVKGVSAPVALGRLPQEASTDRRGSSLATSIANAALSATPSAR